MTAFTCNTGTVERWDSKSGGSTNATLDSYAISAGTTLLIDVDSYWCANHSTAFGSLDTVTFAGIGGTLKITAEGVRVIPYNTGSGNVPAIGTSITQGGVSGYLLGVWDNWQSEPTAAGVAMPANGYIKVRAKTGGDYATGALGGIGASATGADVQGWIEVRGADTATITVPRIGTVILGEEHWFELGTTNGSRGQVLECPCTATVAGTFPAVWIETSAGSGVYERFKGVGSMANLSSNPTDYRGKMVWSTTSGIRIGSDGTNNVGYLPSTGCKVRIPAVILTTCTRTVSGSGPRVLPNATLATRQEFVTSGAGDITINGAVAQWYCNFNQAFRADISNAAINDTVVVSEIASPIDIDNVVIAPTQSQGNIALNMASCFAGGTVSNSTFVRTTVTSTAAAQINYCKDIAFSSVEAGGLLNRTATAVYTWSQTQNQGCTFTDCVAIGASFRIIGSDSAVTDLVYADNFSGTTGTSNGQYAIAVETNSRNVMVEGMSFGGLTNVHPYAGLVSVTASYDTTVRNIGDTTTPLNLGSANACGLIFNGAGNNDGIRLQRLYCSNTRTGPYAFVNSDNNVTIETVAGDYADTSVIASLNTITKGVRLTGATGGQTSVYGTHWKDSFTSATVGKVEILCNEQTVASAAQCSSTGGTPRFTSGGQLALTAVGDQVTWEMQYFALGHTALANLAATLTGTNTGNLTYEFQYNFGSGYNGSWLTLNATNLNAAGAINPAVGVKLKVRATCATANAGNLLTNIAIPTVTTSTAQNEQYPLDTFTLTLTGLVSGSDVVVLAHGTETVLGTQEDIAGTSYAFVYETPEAVDIAIYKEGYFPHTTLYNYTLPSADASVPVVQVQDPSYLT